jgi:hypothetical protein
MLVRGPSGWVTVGDWSVFGGFFQEFSWTDSCRKFFGNEP